MATVEDLPRGRVTGQFLFVSQDNEDAGTAPNAVIVSGYVRFTCSATPPLKYKLKKVSAVPLVHDAIFDSQGYLMPMTESQSAIPGSVEPGMELLADGEGVNPRGFTWVVSFHLREIATGRNIDIPSFPIYLSDGATVDITDVMPIAEANGVRIIRGDSAYEIALQAGFVGTVEEWIESLKVKGDTGPANKLTIGTVARTTTAGASLTGTAPNQVLNLNLPQGDRGLTGPANSLSIGTVSTAAAAAKATITGTAPTQVLNLEVPKGDKGDVGATPNITIGEVTTTANPADGVWVAGLIKGSPDVAAALASSFPSIMKGDKGDTGIGWGVTTIPDGSLDNLRTPGVYRQNDGAKGLLTSNYPMTNFAGIVEVMVWADSFSVIQRATPIPTAGSSSGTVRGVYVRGYRGTGWSSWDFIPTQKVSTDANGYRTVTTTDHLGTEIPLAGPGGFTLPTVVYSPADANALTTPGVYFQTSGSTVALNWPIAGKGHLYVYGAPGSLHQEFTIFTPVTGTASKVRYVRDQLTATTWSAWQIYTAQNATIGADGFKTISTYDPATNSDIPIAGPGGITVGVNLPISTDLNTVLTPGIYQQPNSIAVTTAGLNYPPMTNVNGSVRGVLTVSSWNGGSNTATQDFTTIGTGANSATDSQRPGVTYRRHYYNGFWSAWNAIVAQRVDNSVGRAIYTWDDVNNREQLIYGDTGDINISHLLTGVAAGAGAHINRVGNMVNLHIQHCVPLPENVGLSNFTLLIPPIGFRPPTGSFDKLFYVPTNLVGTPLRSIVLSQNMRVYSAAAGDSYRFSWTFRTNDPWPTSLPTAPPAQ